MTHKEIVGKVAKWLKRHKQNIAVPNCTLILKELVSLNHSGEVPDVLGFNCWSSVMIEVKCSRKDFIRDQRKRHKKHSEGAGEFKFYCCPERLLTPMQMPDGYGLLWIDDKGKISIMKEAKRHKNADMRTERSMLLSYIRRMKNNEINQ